MQGDCCSDEGTRLQQDLFPGVRDNRETVLFLCETDRRMLDSAGNHEITTVPITGRALFGLHWRFRAVVRA